MLYNIYNLLFIRLAVITHNWIVIRHPVTIIFIFIIVLPYVRIRNRELNFFFSFKKSARTSAD